MLQTLSREFSFRCKGFRAFPASYTFLRAPVTTVAFLSFMFNCRKKIQGLSMPCCENTASKGFERRYIYYEKV
jgi:hypothetical protein